LINIQSIPHDSSQNALWHSRPHSKVEIGAIRAPEHGVIKSSHRCNNKDRYCHFEKIQKNPKKSIMFIS
jgi:hypothetical protein